MPCIVPSAAAFQSVGGRAEHAESTTDPELASQHCALSRSMSAPPEVSPRFAQTPEGLATTEPSGLTTAQRLGVYPGRRGTRM